MQQQLTQSEVEWLRCLAISRKLEPRLPEHIRRKLMSEHLVAEHRGRPELTKTGAALLQER